MMTGAVGFALSVTLVPVAWRGARAWFDARSRKQVPTAGYWVVFVVGLLGAAWALFGIVQQSDRTILQGWAVEAFTFGYLWLARIGLNQERRKAEAAAGTVIRGARVIEPSRPAIRRDTHALDIAGITIPAELEAQHFLFTGTTGTGKTQAINAMLRTIRERAQRAVIADPGGGFFARFGQAGDVLFNPFDARSVAWSPFAEIEQPYDCDRIAKAIVPDGAGDGAEWHHYAQNFTAAVLRAMHQQGERSIKQMLYWLTTADAKELAVILGGTPAAALCAKGNERMLASTRGVLSSYLGVFPYLPDTGDFSVREWVRGGRGWLFVTYRDDQMGLLRGLVATVMELAIVEGLSLSEDQERGLWFVMDEVDSLGKVTSLRAGLTKLRKYGGRCILGLQTVAQLRATYGRDEAQTLMANCSTKLVLRAGDAETGRAMEEELGQQEIERMTVSASKTHKELFGGSTSTSQQYTRQSAVMASEVMGLANLCGFLKMPGDTIHRVQLDYVAMPEIQPGFQGR